MKTSQKLNYSPENKVPAYSGVFKTLYMRKADVVSIIAEKTGIPKVDVLVTLESFFKEVKETLAKSEPVYIRGFGSFIVKKRAAKIGRNIKRNVAVEIPEQFIPAFRPAKELVAMVKNNAKSATSDKEMYNED